MTRVLATMFDEAGIIRRMVRDAAGRVHTEVNSDRLGEYEDDLLASADFADARRHQPGLGKPVPRVAIHLNDEEKARVVALAMIDGVAEKIRTRTLGAEDGAKLAQLLPGVRAKMASAPAAEVNEVVVGALLETGILEEA